MDNEEVKAPQPDNSHSDPHEAPQVPKDEPSSSEIDQSAIQGSEDKPSPEIPNAQAPPQQPEKQDVAQKGPSSQNDQDRTALVSYGRMNLIGEFSRPSEGEFPIATKVVVRTERGLEIGKIVLGYCEGCGDRGVSRQKWKHYVGQEGTDYDISHQGRILRRVSEQDLIDQEHLDRNASKKIELCQKIIDEMQLEMKIVDAEHLFGGDRILFYFKSEKRVDFRKLVRRLAKEYQTRIEMRQVGARDEAKLLADYERCGRQCCCRSFLSQLAPVNMRMAKVQKATLDPAKISGRCGRLMCCLRYEQGTYDELRKNLPPRNTVVQTPDGEGIVIDRQILTQLVMVSLADNKRVAFPVSQISVAPKKPTPSASPQAKDQPAAKENSPNAAQAKPQADANSDAKSNGPKKRRRGRRRNQNQNRPQDPQS